MYMPKWTCSVTIVNETDGTLELISRIGSIRTAVADMVVAVYCIVVILNVIIKGYVDCRNDGILFVYFCAIIPAFADCVSCFIKDMALMHFIKEDK